MSSGFEIEAASPARRKWKPSGLRLHPEVRRALHAHALLEGVTIGESLHRILVERLRDRGLLASLTGRERPE
jgi:hypothetical protein